MFSFSPLVYTRPWTQVGERQQIHTSARQYIPAHTNTNSYPSSPSQRDAKAAWFEEFILTAISRNEKSTPIRKTLRKYATRFPSLPFPSTHIFSNMWQEFQETQSSALSVKHQDSAWCRLVWFVYIILVIFNVQRGYQQPKTLSIMKQQKIHTTRILWYKTLSMVTARLP